MITRAQYEEAKDTGDMKRVQDYADQLVEMSTLALTQFRKCGFMDEPGHKLEDNVMFQQLANATYWQTEIKDKKIRD